MSLAMARVQMVHQKVVKLAKMAGRIQMKMVALVRHRLLSN